MIQIKVFSSVENFSEIYTNAMFTIYAICHSDYDMSCMCYNVHLECPFED